MTNNINNEWWNSLQHNDINTIIQLGDKYPDLIWSTLNDPSFLPSTNNSKINILQRVEILGVSLDNINALQWLIFNYSEDDNIKSIIYYILEKAKPTDLNNGLWGSKNNTVLHLVCLLGYEDICSMILQKGASPDVKNKDGYLPIHVAQKESILQLLELSSSSSKKNINDNKTNPTKRKNLKNNEDNTSSSNLESNSSIHRPNYSNPNRFQQLKQLAELSSHHQSVSNSDTKTSPSSKTTNNNNNNNNNNKFNINGNTKPSTMKHKDGHYFKPGCVEQRKQKVLNEEEAELQKHREHRRKDIALLAQRSAVKNNPFIKNESDSITKSIKRRQKSIPSLSSPSSTSTSPSPSPSSSSSTSHVKDLDGSNKIEQPSSTINVIKEEDEIVLEDDDGENSINNKPKRNSKVINSLQTKSVVSSSVFLQTESSSLPKKKSSTTSLNKDITKAQKKYSITLNDKFEVTDPLPSSSAIPTTSSDSTPLNSPSLDRTSSSETTTSLDSTQSSSSPSNNNNTSFIHSSIAIPKVNDCHEELSSKIEISPEEMELLQNTKSFENNQPSSPISPVIIDKSNLEQRRISGCQKSNWTKELQSLSSPSIVDKKMNKKASQQNNGDIIESLIISENNNLHHEKQKYVNSKYQHDHYDRLDKSLKSSLLPSSPSSSTTHHSEYKQQIKKEFDSSSLSENTDFGNISSTTTSRYIRRLPTYDSIPYVKSKSTFLDDDKDEKSSYIIKEGNNNNSNQDFDHSINKLNNPSVTSTLPNLSKKQPNHHHHPLVRSVSTFESTSSLTSFMNSSPFFSSSNKKPSNHLLNNHSLTSSSTLNNDHQLHQQQNGPGKLYVRVKGVNDVLLPIPSKDKAYVRCVINDGKYEYISGYEPLSQQMTFGYECIIDCKPGMIITISLHIRADYLLKKPLTKLLTTVQRKRKGSLSAFISNEDGSVGQTRFAVKDMLNACYRRSFTSQFHCFNAWYIPPSYSAAISSSSPSSSLLPFASFNHHLNNNKKKSSSLNKNLNDLVDDDDDDSVLKVIGNFDVELLYLPLSDPNAVIPKNLRECDMAIKLQQWNETCLDTEFVPKKIHRPSPRIS